MTHGKPIPDIEDPVTGPYWAAANEGRLVVQQCQNCEKFHHPPVGICWKCQSTDLKFKELSGKGKVYTYTIVRDQRMPAFDDLVPFVLARVTPDGTPSTLLLTNIVGTPIDKVEIGMPVEVEFEEIAQGVRIPQFHPAR